MDRLISKPSDYNLLIVEKSSTVLTKSGEDNDYVLEGVFGEIDVKNKNNRIYTEGEYLPQIESLQQKISSSKLLGELDHPQQFDISLKNVSHIIEELRYDKENKKVMGKIRLLDTDAGKQAKALVDSGVPLHISSRAAGEVSEGGKVKIKQLFTYDLVADPGFANAELKRVNESFGFDNDDNLFIYEVFKKQETIKTTENKKDQKMEEFVKTDDFNNYTKYLAEQIKGLKSALNDLSENSKEGSDSTSEEIKTVTAHNDHIVEQINSLTEYVKYVAEKTDQSISYTEHVAEKADQGIQYSEYVAEKLDQGISYTEHVAESVSNIKDYANYLAETYNNGTETSEKLIEYVNYLRENVQNVSEYANYIAESINETLVIEGDVNEGDDVTAKEFDKADKDNELDKVGNNSGEAIKADGGAGQEHADLDDDSKDVTTPDEHEEGKAKAPTNDGKDAAHDPLESYKNSISDKLNTLLEKATAKENKDPHFFKLVSSATAEKYNALNEEAKSLVRKEVELSGFLTESQIVRLIDNSQKAEETKVINENYFVAAMPEEYKAKWESLSEKKKNQITAQSKTHKLESEYQVRNFWQTRDLREVAPVMEKVEMITESKKEETKKLPYSLDGVKESIAKRFNK